MSKFTSDIIEKYPQYLNDESSIVVGSADRLYFPTDETEVQQIILDSKQQKMPVTVSGGGTGISGGRVPLSGWILATDKMRSISQPGFEEWTDPESKQKYQVKLVEIDDSSAIVTIPVSMTLKAFVETLPPKKELRSVGSGG